MTLSVTLGALGHCGVVMLLLVFPVLLLAAFVWTGSRLVVAGRQVERAQAGSTARSVDRRLAEARVRVETLVMPEVEADELVASAGAHESRAQTYSVVGLGLLGLAAAIALGVLLLL